MEISTMAITEIPLEQKEAVPVNDDSLYEVVNGQRVELPPMGAFETNLASRIVVFLANHANTKGLGRVVFHRALNFFIHWRFFTVSGTSTMIRERLSR